MGVRGVGGARCRARQSAILRCAMTAKGPTRKSGDAISTSALPPTADIPESGCDVRKVPLPEVVNLFDHLIGAGEQRRWHFEAELFRSLEIDTQLELGRLVKRDISRIS